MTQPASSGPLTVGAVVDLLATQLVALYVAAEQQLIATLAQIASAGLEAPAGSMERLDMARAMRRAAERIATRLRLRAYPLAQQIADQAARYGADYATMTLRRLAGTDKGLLPQMLTPGGHASLAAQRIALDLIGRLDSTLPRLTRFAEDAYRAAVTEAATRVVQGLETPATGQSLAWRKLTAQGIDGFTDQSGRNWNLSSYVEMATRTTVQRAYNAAHLDRMQALGIEYFTVNHDGHPCPLCRPWEGQVLSTGTVGPVTTAAADRDAIVTFTVKGTVDEAIAAGLQHPNCFPGGVLVSSPSGVDAADSRWYEGELVVIHTAGGDELPVTPNHPVLTPEGWIAAGQLAVGDCVMRYSVDVHADAIVRPDDQQVPAPIGEVFDALRETSPMSAVSVPAAAEQFHGDGKGSDVQVVFSDRFLDDNRVCAHRVKAARKVALLGSGVGLAGLLGGRALHQIGLGARHAAYGLMRRFRQGQPLVRSHPSQTAPHGFASADRRSGAEQDSADGGLVGVEDGRDLALSLAGAVTLDHIVDISSREHAGHVYNLQSGNGWYVANSIVVHNCRHVFVPYLPGVTQTSTEPAWTAADQARYDATQQLRALERRLRRYKRESLGALNDNDRRTANAKVRATQGLIRQHVATHGLIRRSRREQLNLGN